MKFSLLTPRDCELDSQVVYEAVATLNPDTDILVLPFHKSDHHVLAAEFAAGLDIAVEFVRFPQQECDLTIIFFENEDTGVQSFETHKHKAAV